MQNNELKLKELELETLLEITNSLLEFESVQELLQEILYKACSILDASSGFILTEDKPQTCLYPVLPSTLMNRYYNPSYSIKREVF